MGCAPCKKKNWGLKTCKFGAISDMTTSDFNYEYLQNGSISISGQRCDQERFLPRSAKSPVNFGPRTTSWTCEFGTTFIDFFGRPYFGPYGCCLYTLPGTGYHPAIHVRKHFETLSQNPASLQCKVTSGTLRHPQTPTGTPMQSTGTHGCQNGTMWHAGVPLRHLCANPFC